jgi:hypothetical protein
MAVTVQDIIDSARYDLVDFVDGAGVGIEFDDTELLNYLNRMVGLMDSQLSALQSDLVLGTDDSLLTTANLDYVDISSLNSGLWNRLRNVWISGSSRMEQVSVNYMHYTRQFRKSMLVEDSAVAVGDFCKTILRTTTDLTGLGAGDNNNGTYWTCDVAGTLGASDRVWKFSSGKPTIWALQGQNILLPTAAGSIYSILTNYDKKSAVLTLTGSMPYFDTFNEFFREMLVMTAKAKKEGILDRADSMLNEMFRSRAMTEEIQRGFIPRPYVYWEF